MNHDISISVVVNTFNRDTMLARTLEGLSKLRYRGEFEVVVVNGPSTDGTEDVLAAAGATIRSASVKVANLSMSRNVGISISRGDVVAFIDDDAVPESSWLTEIAAAYEDPMVGGAGGFVFDHTGFSYQYKFGVLNRLGVADLAPKAPQPELSFPGSFSFPHLLGANSSYRRSALLEIDGFDEEFDYYLDESDVQARLVDAGYIIAQVPRAVVHHSYAPSNIRGPNRVAKNRFAVLKNKLYFSLIHGRTYLSIHEILAEQHRFVEIQRADVKWAVAEGLLEEADLIQFERDVDRAIEVGLSAGLAGRRPNSIDIQTRRDSALLVYPTVKADLPNVVLVSQEFPPASRGGVGTFVRDLAVGLAVAGHEVHVITRSAEHSRVDFEHGIWVHRLATLEAKKAPPQNWQVPDHIWNWAETARSEVEKIDLARAVDVVEAPIWDAQGISLLADGRWPLVTSLQTTLKTWLQTHTVQASDSEWMNTFGRPMLDLERRLMLESDSLRAISNAIRKDIETGYGIQFDDGQALVAHLGIAEPTVAWTGLTGRVTHDPKVVSLLFVGRLEARKGVDTLLKAFAIALSEVPLLVLNLIGDDSLTWDDGNLSLRAVFESEEKSPNVRKAVRFHGQLTDHEVDVAYRNSDIFIAPSTYESFGLVFVEAMARNRAVIGTRVGGIPEVVEDGVTGLLVPVGDAKSLAGAIVRLARDGELRAKMGLAGRRRYEQRFTARAMVVASSAVFDAAVERHTGRK
jgi:glycosyltransferase involved in cell wall biosynthesis